MTRRQADQEPCATMRLAGGHLPRPAGPGSNHPLERVYGGPGLQRSGLFRVGEPVSHQLIGEEPPTPPRTRKTRPLPAWRKGPFHLDASGLGANTDQGTTAS